MKKLLYIALTNLDDSSDGVSKKVRMQCDAFIKNGHDVYCAAYGSDGCYIYEKDKKTKISDFNKVIPSRIILLKSVVTYLKSNTFDTCYIRYFYSDYVFIKILRLLKKDKTKIYVEIPSYPNSYPKLNWRIILKEPLYWMDRMLVKKLEKYVDCIVTIGSNVESIYNIPAINIPNGINVNKYKPHNNSVNTSEINIICVASMYAYQGYDRLIEGAVNYYRTNTHSIKIYIHLVGNGPEIEKYKKRCIEGNIQQYIKFYNRLCDDDLDYIYNKCCIACGMLGFHRKNYTIASPLKTKEYFARGIPFIYAYEEIRLPQDYPYALKLPANDEPIDMNQVIEFYNSYKDHYSEATQSMRNFAKENYSWEHILKFI